MKSLFMNPVLNKEIRLRFRSSKSFIGIASYLSILGLISLGFIGLTLSFDGGTFRPEESRSMFLLISMLQLSLVIFITPGLTGGVISSERERQTLPILLTTAQSSSSIILSKLFSSLAYLLLIVFASAPLYMIVFLYGGISPMSVLASFGLYTFTMLVIGSIGVLASTVIRKTIIAMVTTYSIAFFLTGGLAVITLMLTSFSYTFQQQGQEYIWPFIFASMNIPIMFFSVFEESIMTEFKHMAGFEFSPWIIFFGVYGAVIVGSLALAIRKLRPKMQAREYPK
ncbi:ABC-type transport system involved in multi-copper enzyme maturation permease subunit [Evansella vedderi]|uniref:ABC-type transport system involved in multi-copper enzyme maturation permease subunit n=1 Tax=Evansella vedderi TaxID=38282 RepID=A0ABT9ZP81_9BACI|nr:ABC transporter permease subunit [Evansella vedderi]MDQ0253042.1 ABC-type transport system involved in multi-copper enzyme maturation permease subunit [Evansella vedderi]